MEGVRDGWAGWKGGVSKSSALSILGLELVGRRHFGWADAGRRRQTQVDAGRREVKWLR